MRLEGEEGRVIRSLVDGVRRGDEKKDGRADALLAKELNSMSLKERDALYEQIHGVEAIVDETPDFCDEKLLIMDQALLAIQNKPAYDRASQDYVTGQNFCLSFLRADSFEPKKAAMRLVKFMDLNLDFFGPDTLSWPVYLSNLDKETLKFLKARPFQVLPGRDRSGRAIFMDLHSLVGKLELLSPDSFLKALFYMMSSMSVDEESQKRGSVGISYFADVGPDILFERWTFYKATFAHVSRGTDSVPMRFLCGHFCLEKVELGMMKEVYLLGMGRDRRVRLRVHDGSHQECMYGLMSFGVPVEAFPINYDGTIRMTNHAKWIARRRAKDEIIKRTGRFDGIDLMATNDVLLGRGRTYHQYPGTVRMRNMLVKSDVEQYRNLSSQQKAQMAANVVAVVKQGGGRFIDRRKDGWWVEVKDDAAREKVSSTFRTILSVNAKADSASAIIKAVDGAKRLRIVED